jgi:16S rRNA (cytidine1402-2'-O)-methyltransferase
VPLLVCATPIGNLDDITLRVLSALRDADVVVCEDTRRTRILLDRHGVRPHELVSLHRHNEARRAAWLVPRLQAGETVALVSDAGSPGIQDPGERLVRAALEAGIEVHVLPGASAVSTALVASGLADEGGYRFVGWVPRTSRQRERLWAEVAHTTAPTVAFESPGRLPASLASLASTYPDVCVAVCRELTKQFEEVVRGTAADVASQFAEAPRGEITLVLRGSSADRSGSEAEGIEEAHAAVRELVAAGTPRRVAATVVSRLTGVRRNLLYGEKPSS